MAYLKQYDNMLRLAQLHSVFPASDSSFNLADFNKEYRDALDWAVETYQPPRPLPSSGTWHDFIYFKAEQSVWKYCCKIFFPVRVLRSSQSRRRTSQPRQSSAIPRNAADRSSGTSSSINWHSPSSSKPSSRHNLREYPAIHPPRASALYIEQLPSRGIGSSLAASATRHSNHPGNAQQLRSPTKSATQQPLFWIWRRP